jgi:cytochrome oxidase Cu insertion factor (SCO1/SenC/PrrC family)
MPFRKAALTLGLSLGFAWGCSRSSPPTPVKAEPDEPRPTTAAMTAPPTTPEPPLESARLGATAPDFELPDLDGKRVRLSSLRGSPVVLEWFNPGCPFVRAAHTKGSLVTTASRQANNGVVWLAVNSAGPGKQGYGAEANREGKERFKLEHPILLDESGRVGHAYGAAHTPHLFVIDAAGVLVYRGAIDNSPDAEGESPSGGKLINYVDAALADLKAGRPVATPETEAYGCSVKYQN